MNEEKTFSQKPDIEKKPPSQLPYENDTKKSVIKIIKEIVTFGIIAIGVVLPFRMYVAEPYYVSGESMDPTFKTGDYLIVDKIPYKIEKLKRNSVVVFRFPKDTSKNFIKRIIGLPGDTVNIEDDNITIINKENQENFKLDQSYVVHKSSGKFNITLGSDEYYVLGDNRAESFDSRSWGPVKKKYLLGRPILRLLPLNKIEITPGND